MRVADAEGSQTERQFVVAGFPSLTQAHARYTSLAYTEALRDQTFGRNLVFLEGVPAV